MSIFFIFVLLVIYFMKFQHVNRCPGYDLHYFDLLLTKQNWLPHHQLFNHVPPLNN